MKRPKFSPSFVAANVYDYHVAEPPCDFSTSFGFPFPLGMTGGQFSDTSFIKVGPGFGYRSWYRYQSSICFIVCENGSDVGWAISSVIDWHLKTRS